MPANIDPIYTKKGVQANNGTTGMNQAVLLAANDFTGISANNSLIFTADATNGSYVERIILKPIGTNVVSAMRFFINNGAAVGTATNNTYIGDATLPATTISAVNGMVEVNFYLGFALMPGFKIYMGLATAVAAGWVALPVAGDY